ncbi:thymidylate synthase [Streptomyces phage Wakanda]|uniref:ThyX-like thymidylate synthase n=2 Tax=Wakandavirus TaxID=3044854 RepID=A0A6G8R2Z6_9CAUD|nr:thymidylate synthase [Streptomyces phage Wakanda]YP_010652323.1 thymidylate synthase [Streptomyces phage Muntaha]QIN94004.1 ThyX-like thymidylate synthase [Streptomyces phage Wakanda]QIN94569.1 ThyX-like thymidylate synthase [Streptomyces phage Muntaha]
MEEKIEVLDKGYVRLVKHMGDDLDPVNSAKVSFAKESLEFGDREARLLAFLQREEHSSVFRHSALTFEVYAPLFVARQWWKYAVASTHLEDQNGWNESSRRYVTETPEFYVPGMNEWRSAPDNRKQGSGVPVNQEVGQDFTDLLESFNILGEAYYEQAMAAGVCAEQARLFLPSYGLYVRWRWTCSLGALMHFLQQRLEHDAQKEIQDYAIAVRDLTATKFPVCMGTLGETA